MRAAHAAAAWNLGLGERDHAVISAWPLAFGAESMPERHGRDPPRLRHPDDGATMIQS
jgi:hypothetical protein